MVQIGPHRRIVTLQVLACTPYFVRGGTPEGCSSDMRVFSFRLTAGGSAKNGTFCSVRIGEAILGMRTFPAIRCGDRCRRHSRPSFGQNSPSIPAGRSSGQTGSPATSGSRNQCQISVRSDSVRASSTSTPR